LPQDVPLTEGLAPAGVCEQADRAPPTTALIVGEQRHGTGRPDPTRPARHFKVISPTLKNVRRFEGALDLLAADRGAHPSKHQAAGVWGEPDSLGLAPYDCCVAIEGTTSMGHPRSQQQAKPVATALPRSSTAHSLRPCRSAQKERPASAFFAGANVRRKGLAAGQSP